jgi:hypothetical protein
MRHIAVLVMSVVVALSTATPTALMGAQGPPTNADDTFEIPAGELCEFGIHFDVSGKMKTIELPRGRTIFTFPGLSATLTNLDHPENQETLRITGSFHQTVLENGDVKTVFTGRNLLMSWCGLPFDTLTLSPQGSSRRTGKWKCGCRDSACTQSYWQIQSFKR